MNGLKIYIYFKNVSKKKKTHEKYNLIDFAKLSAIISLYTKDNSPEKWFYKNIK